MAAEDLPNEFDIIILGTGLTETITAAAFSRIGLKVLHLDRHDYYGGAYANFNLEGIETWKQRNIELATKEEPLGTSDVSEDVKKVLQEGERAFRLPEEKARAFNIKSQYHVRERTAEEEAEAAKQGSCKFNFAATIPMLEPSFSSSTEEASVSKVKEVVPDSELSDPSGTGNSLSQANIAGHCIVEEKQESDEIQVSGSDSSSKDDCEGGVPVISKDDVNFKAESFSAADSDVDNCKKDSSGVPNSDQPCDNKEEENLSQNYQSEDKDNTAQSLDSSLSKNWTVGGLKDNWRRYCFDISPKVLYCSGELIDLLIQSDVARYCEFRTVSRVLTMLKDQLQQVPCSRADLFSSKIVSLIEKRLMMKFLQFVAEYEKSPEEYQDYIGKPFVEFLKSKKLSASIKHFIQYSIAMATDDVLTEEALQRTQKFLRSLGRYGNTALLFPLYGTGELPQAFSRLSAVFGGIYCLTLSASHLITDSDNKCCGVITSAGQSIRCKYVIAEASYLPVEYVQAMSSRKLSRAILITSGSILPSEEAELSILNFVCKGDPTRPVTLLELPPSTCVCPKHVFIVHLTRIGVCSDAEEDFIDVMEKLFKNEGEEEERPKILWSMFFQQEDKSQLRQSELIPRNVLVSSGGGDAHVDLDFCVHEAKAIFKTVCPDEEFLPKPPNPEDIIHVDDSDIASGSLSSEFQKEGDIDSREEESLREKADADSISSAQPENTTNLDTLTENASSK